MASDPPIGLMHILFMLLIGCATPNDDVITDFNDSAREKQFHIHVMTTH
jgi:hypothetical protein